MTSELWQRIRAARGAAGLKQHEIADRVGVSRVAVGHWESADPERRTRPPIDSLRIFAEMTGAPLDWLMSDESDIHPYWITDDPGAVPAEEHIVVPYLEDGLFRLVRTLRENPGVSSCRAASELGLTVSAEIPMSTKLGGIMQFEYSDRFFWFTILCPSMSPEVLPHDGVLVDPDGVLNHGSLLAMRSLDSPNGIGLRRVRVTEAGDHAFSAVLEASNERALKYQIDDTPIQDVDITKAIIEHEAAAGRLVLGAVKQTIRWYF